MLMGEYAVLYGKHALVAAINRRIFIEISSSDIDIIDSDLYGRHTESFPQKLLLIRRIKESIAPYVKCNITIRSEFSDKLGFGSSGAAIAATVSALLLFTKKISNIKDSKYIIFNEAKKYIGALSGSDIAASIYGNIVYYNIAEGIKDEMPSRDLKIYSMFSGVKKDSNQAVKEFEILRNNNTYIYNQIFNLAELITTKAYSSIGSKNWKELGMLMNIYSAIHQSIGANTPKLEELLHKLRSFCYGAKISGAGYGDSVIGITETPLSIAEDITLLNIEEDGARIES